MCYVDGTSTIEGILVMNILILFQFINITCTYGLECHVLYFTMAAFICNDTTKQLHFTQFHSGSAADSKVGK